MAFNNDSARARKLAMALIAAADAADERFC